MVLSFFFFKQKTAYEMRISDWSSDVCSSDLRDAVIGDIRKVRGEIEASPRPGLPLYITEWSTSYNPRDPIHDAYLSAPFILNKLKGTEKDAQSMSYWVYSDLFEEPGPPPKIERAHV